MFIREIILNKLRQVKYPPSNKDIVSSGLIKSINVFERNLEVVLWKTEEVFTIKQSILSNLNDYQKDFSIQISFENMPRQMNPQPPAMNLQTADLFFKLAVCSPRGDAQKSLFVINLAAAFARKQFSVGLVDTDLYGPGYSAINGMEEMPRYTNRDIYMYERYGINLISLQKLLDLQTPGIWRGASLQQCLQHVINEVRSSNLQLLIFDLPPGSGDSILALMQTVQFDGIILLSRPGQDQEHCLQKSIHLIDELKTPIFGMIEDVGLRDKPAYKTIPTKVNKLGQISLDQIYRETVQSNTPIMGGDSQRFFNQLADKIATNMYH